MINPSQSIREISNIRESLKKYKSYTEATEAIKDIDETLNMAGLLIQGVLIDSRNALHKLDAEHKLEVLAIEAKSMIHLELVNLYGKRSHTAEILKRLTIEAVKDLQSKYELCGKDCETLENIIAESL